MGVVGGGEFGHGSCVDGGGESWVGGGLVVARAYDPVRRWMSPGGVGGVVAAEAGAQGAGADGLLCGLEPSPVCCGCGVVGVVGGGEAGRGACQVGEWGAGRGGEVLGRVVVEVEFGCGQGAVAVKGDAGAIEELGQSQPLGVGEALGVGGGCFAGQWPYTEHARSG
ncbi:hypothetical protein SSPO_001680 [Streptomyces antimycoticus]|uniref:Uncharacterized protein n=1 Tax=Streptomyces antimycoticus TaxID=68175 RepID=A0A499UCP0_9ACTN|nr:hypothetical protein SSPO_001680 [Streptomyces antimycoticus]